MSVYTNTLNLNLNEVAVLDFREANQSGTVSVARVAMTYESFKAFHKVMGEAIEQHDKKLHELQRTKGNMN